MKPFVRVKIISGHEYLYEVTPYYDGKSGKVRQRSRYIGKKQPADDAGAMPVQHSRVLSSGEYLPFIAAARSLGMDEIMEEFLPREDCMAVAALAICLATRPCPLPVVKEWYGRCVVSLAYPGADLRPDAIISLLRRLSHDRVMEQYTEARSDGWSGRRKMAGIVSLPRREDDLFLRECSHPGSGPGSDFFLFVADPDTGIISGFSKLPETFRHRIEMLGRTARILGDGTPVILIEDSLSPHHLDEILRAGLQFILPVSPSGVIPDHQLGKILRAVPIELNYRSINNEPVYVRNCSVDAGGASCPGFLVMNQRAEQTARLRLRREMYRISENLKHAVASGIANPEEMIKDIAGDLSHLYCRRSGTTGCGATVDHAAVTRAMNDAGTLLLLNNTPLRKETCLALIAKRRSFNEILEERSREFSRMLSGTEVTAFCDEGFVFIVALASAIRWRIDHLLPAVHSRAGISAEALMTVLAPVRMRVGPGRRREISGLLPAHQAVLEALSAFPEQVIPGEGGDRRPGCRET